jgi:hypothetical protein
MRREGNPYWDLQSPKIDEKRGKSLLGPPIGHKYDNDIQSIVHKTFTI